jgi:hypothetical protein
MSANSQRLWIEVVLSRGIPFWDEPYFFGIFPQYLEKVPIFPQDPIFLETPPPFSKLPLGLARRKSPLWKSIPLSGNIYRF